MSKYLYHSWGKNPEQKAVEKEYNKQYYQEHKAEIREKRMDKLRKASQDASDYKLFKTNLMKNKGASGTARNEAAKAEKAYNDNWWKLHDERMGDIAGKVTVDLGSAFVDQLLKGE